MRERANRAKEPRGTESPTVKKTQMVTDNQAARSVLGSAKGLLEQRWHQVLLGLLIAAQLAVNRAWLSTNLVLLGWDRPRHLIESLVYNDILQYVSLRSMFEAWVHSGYYPPLFHWAMVAFYRLFGISMDVAASVNMVFLIVLLVAVYGIGSRMGGRGVGLLSAFITSTLPMIFAMSRYTYIEFSLTAMVALSIWLLLLSRGFTHRRYSLLFGLSAGFGLLTKWTFSLFVFPALLVVILRAGVLSGARKNLSSLALDRKWMLVSAALGAVFTLLWYVPNVERAATLPMGHLLVPVSWFLLGGLIYVLRQPGGQGWNMMGSLWLCIVVAGSWYLPRIDFVNHTFLIAWGRPERQSWAFGYYLDHLTHEHLSLVYMIVLVLVSVGLLVLAWRALRHGRPWEQIVTSDFLLLFLWIVLPYLVLSFRPSSKHSRFIMPMLPALGVLMAYGLSRIRLRRARLAAVALVALLGTGQWLALSFDGLPWLRDAAVVGPVNSFAHMFQNQLPNSGGTDNGFWIVPEMLQYISDEAEARGQPLELGLLVNTRQVHDEHFLYAIYTTYGNVRLRELAQNWTGRPAYLQLFEVDYVAVPSANPDHKLDVESLEVVEMLLDAPPSLFQEAFRLVREYPLPDGNIIYLYEKEYPLPEGYEAEQYEALARELEKLVGDGDALLLHPARQVTLLGRYYLGRPDLIMLPTTESADEDALAGLLEQTASGHDRLATVFEPGQGEDLRSFVGLWLSDYCLPAFDAWYGPAQMTLYACGPGSSGEQAGVGIDADFDGQIRLVSHSPLPQRISSGEILRLTLIWQADAQIDRDYKVYVHLVDAEGNIVAQRDSEPVAGWHPTSGWRFGEVVRDRHGLTTTPDVVAGEYGVQVGLYDSEGQRLSVLDEAGRLLGDGVSLGAVEVVGP
jgi:4-amino-4-deoxy-L-arabinose transferase-like glycosyltransferase